MHKLSERSEVPEKSRILTEIVYLAGDAAFWMRAVSISLSYPEHQGQRAVLARLAEHAANRATDVLRHLEARAGEPGPQIRAECPP